MFNHLFEFDLISNMNKFQCVTRVRRSGTGKPRKWEQYLPNLAFMSIFSDDALRPGLRPRLPPSLRSCKHPIWMQSLYNDYKFLLQNSINKIQRWTYHLLLES